MKTYVCAYFGAALVAMIMMPIVTRIARALRIVDVPGVRRVHDSPVPRIGGLPIAVGALALVIPVLALNNVIGQAFREIERQFTVMLVASLFMFIVGFIDDVRGLRARTKLAAQVLAAAMVCGFGMLVDSVTVWGHTLELGWLSWPITILWIVGITNAVNLIDGLDGLAAGISAIACGVIAAFSVYTHQTVMALLMLALLGSLTGFLFFNFNPARIFLGDSGTLFVGFVLASASVMCTVKSATLVGLALPALALGLPIFDTLTSIVRRMLERRSIFSPDRNHIHHRLLMMGLHQRGAVIVMYVVTLLAACLGLFMMVSRDTGALVIFVAASVLNLALFRIAGAIRLRESLAILKRNLGTARQTRAERRQFEDVELRMRETESFEEWWAVLCAAAENMDFVWMSLSLRNRDRAVVTSVWRRSGPPALDGRAVRIAMPVGSFRSGHSVWVDAAVMVNGSLEAAGRQTTLFERLVDEHRMKVVLGVLKSTGGVKSEKRLGA